MLPENKCQSINLKEKSEIVAKDERKKKVLPFQGWLLPLKAIHSVKLVILCPQQSRTGGNLVLLIMCIITNTVVLLANYL